MFNPMKPFLKGIEQAEKRPKNPKPVLRYQPNPDQLIDALHTLNNSCVTLVKILKIKQQRNLKEKEANNGK